MKFYDTLIGEYVSSEKLNITSLEEEALFHYNYKFINKKTDIFEEEYAGLEQVNIIKKLYSNHQKNGLIDNDIINNIEIPLLTVLKKMELNGVKIDINKMQEIGRILNIEIKKEEEIIFEISQEKFNINSPKQVGVILFEKLFLPMGKKTKTGYSVDNEVLEALSFKYPIAKHINNYRQYKKLLSTYIDGLQEFIKKDTQTIHTNYNQTNTTTGRLSSQNPNLQNIPSKSSGIASLVREIFIPFKNEDLIVSIDYSQIEVRILAIMSKDENLLGAFKSGVDIHSNTGYFLFAKDELSSDERRIAKRVNFGVIYGISPFGLAKMIGISQSEAREYINKFYEKYNGVKIFFENTISSCEKTGYVETMFGRKRYIKSINDSNTIVQKQAQREAINMPIQGTAADIIKIAMIKIDDLIEKGGYNTKIILQVHDELVFNFDKNEIDLLLPQIVDIMENIIQANISLKVEYGIGKNWKLSK